MGILVTYLEFNWNHRMSLHVPIGTLNWSGAYSSCLTNFIKKGTIVF